MGTKLARPAGQKFERVASVAWMVGLGRGANPKWPDPDITREGGRGCLGFRQLAREIGPVVLGSLGGKSTWTRTRCRGYSRMYSVYWLS
jgi:hypothetical protein